MASEEAEARESLGFLSWLFSGDFFLFSRVRFEDASCAA